MSDYFDNTHLDRSRNAPSSNLQRGRDHHGPPSRNRTWIAIVIAMVIVGLGAWLLATNGADSDDAPQGRQVPSEAPGAGASHDVVGFGE